MYKEYTLVFNVKTLNTALYKDSPKVVKQFYRLSNPNEIYFSTNAGIDLKNSEYCPPEFKPNERNIIVIPNKSIENGVIPLIKNCKFKLNEKITKQSRGDINKFIKHAISYHRTRQNINYANGVLNLMNSVALKTEKQLPKTTTQTEMEM